MFNYSEGIIQFGNIVMFAVSFPLAPLFSMITNVLEINIKLNQMTSFSRRRKAVGSNGIGLWVMVMEFFAIVCIPCNISILYFTGNAKNDYNDETGKNNTTVEVNLKNTLTHRNSVFWTPMMIAALMVLLEHILVGLKIIIAAAIPDTDSKTIEAELKRRDVIDKAIQNLQAFKLKEDGETYDEIAARLDKEAATKMKEASSSLHMSLKNSVNFNT